MSRWCYLSEEERQDVHHALRMLLKSWLPPRDEERERIERMADEIWNEHAERVAFKAAVRARQPPLARDPEWPLPEEC